jgi:hypothetical protein
MRQQLDCIKDASTSTEDRRRQLEQESGGRWIILGQDSNHTAMSLHSAKRSKAGSAINER